MTTSMLAGLKFNKFQFYFLSTKKIIPYRLIGQNNTGLNFRLFRKIL